MKSDVIRDTEDHISEEGLQKSATRLVGPGAVLVVMRSGILRHSVPVGVNAIPVALNQDMRAMIPDERIEPRYLARLIEGHQAELLRAWSKEGTTVESLESDLLGETEVPVPPRFQQCAIADFLDQETQTIDALVRAKERVLNLLAEKRQGLIIQAVTRGLNPNVPLRDSGLRWLGKIPKHWTTERLRFFLTVLEQGWSPQAEERVPENGAWGVLKLNSVNRGVFDRTKAKALPPGLTIQPNLEIRPLDFLVTRANTPELVGDVCFVTESAPRLILCDLIYRLRLKEKRINGAFLNYFLLSPTGRIQIAADARGSSNSMVKISQEHIKNWWIPVPPLTEQAAIVTHVLTETAKLDALRAATERTISLLKERRAALIAAAVTGQIEV
jgi:type I restriction enzyme S subunit